MMETQVQANVVFTDDAYLKTRYFPRADGGYTIRVGRGRPAGYPFLQGALRQGGQDGTGAGMHGLCL